MQEFGLMERFADPTMFETLTVGEKAAASLVTTLMGMGTTFAVLILLWGIIAFVSKLLNSASVKVQKAETAAEKAPSSIASTRTEHDLLQQELVAVIMAAIVEADKKLTFNDLKIVSLNKVEPVRTQRWMKPKAGTVYKKDSRDL